MDSNRKQNTGRGSGRQGGITKGRRKLLELLDVVTILIVVII